MSPSTPNSLRKHYGTWSICDSHSLRRARHAPRLAVAATFGSSLPEIVEPASAATNGEAGNLRLEPLDRIGDWRVAEDAEVVRAAGVLPNIFAIEHKILAEGLL